MGRPKILDVRGNQEGIELVQLDFLFRAPVREPKYGATIRLARIAIANICGEELGEAPPCFLACVKKQRRNVSDTRTRELTGLRDDVLIGHLETGTNRA